MSPVKEVFAFLEHGGVPLPADDDPRPVGVVLPKGEAVLSHSNVCSQQCQAERVNERPLDSILAIPRRLLRVPMKVRARGDRFLRTIASFQRLLGLAAATLLLGCCGTAFAASEPCPTGAPGVTSIVCVDSQQFRTMPDGFVGLSLEFDQVRDYVQASAPGCDYANAPYSRLNPAFLQLVRNLDPPSAADPSPRPVIRIGGDSSEIVAGPGAPARLRMHACPNHVPNKEQRNSPDVLGPYWFAAVADFANQLHARLILDLRQSGAGQAFPGTSEAKDLADGLMSNPFRRLNPLVASVSQLEIGNEPEGPSHPIAGYLPPYQGPYFADFTRLRKTIVAADWGGPAPGVAGPVTGAVGGNVARVGSNVAALRHFLGAEPVTMATIHHYALRGANCRGHATLPQLLHAYTGRGSSGYNFMQGFVPAAVHATSRVPGGVRVDELGSVTCQGQPGVSNSFASTLWVLESLFRLAYKGVSGVNVHTQEQANNDPFQPPFGLGSLPPGHSDPGQMAVNPEYYGMYAFAKTAVSGSTLMGTSVCCYRGGVDKTNSLAIRAWAAQQPGTGGPLSVVVLYNGSSRRTVAVNVGPAYHDGLATLDCIRDGSVDSTSSPTYDGSTFDPSTGLAPAQSQPVQSGRRHLYQVTFTGPGIAILTIGQPARMLPNTGTC